MPAAKDHPAPEPTTFESDAAEAVHHLRDAFARIIEQKCRESKAVTDLCEAFGIHRKLAWQVSKVAYTDDAFVAARHMPSAKSLDAWLDAARAAGIPARMITAARQAAHRFESLVASHAANRAELDMLLESCAPDVDAAAAERWRQQAFMGNSFTWGAHCDVLLGLVALVPSEDRPRSFHVAQVRGLIGFRQTRPGVRWTVSQSVVADDQARAASGIRREPLDPDAAKAHGGVPVIADFCSKPVPQLTRRPGPDGLLYDEFVPGPVGESGKRTLLTGEVMRNIGAP